MKIILTDRLKEYLNEKQVNNLFVFETAPGGC